MYSTHNNPVDFQHLDDIQNETEAGPSEYVKLNSQIFANGSLNRSLLDSKLGEVSLLRDVSKPGDLLRDSRWFVYVISGFPHSKNRNYFVFLQADWPVI